MALSKLNYIPGTVEAATDEPLIPASPVLNTWYPFKVGDWEHAFADIVIKQGGSAIPASAYELEIDKRYTAREASATGKTVYSRWRIIDAAYDATATTISGNNFGSYIDNEYLKARFDSIAAPPAADVSYDNSTSGLTADQVQAAIDELAVATPAAEVTYNNSTSGLAATDVQGAIDEIDSIVDALISPKKGAEVNAYSYTGATSPQTGTVKIENPVSTHARGQYAIVEIKTVNGSGSSCTGYLSTSVTGAESYDSDWAIILPATPQNSTKAVVVMLPFGLYRVYFSGMTAAGSTITVKYKIIDSGIAYA